MTAPQLVTAGNERRVDVYLFCLAFPLFSTVPLDFPPMFHFVYFSFKLPFIDLATQCIYSL